MPGSGILVYDFIAAVRSTLESPSLRDAWQPALNLLGNVAGFSAIMKDGISLLKPGSERFETVKSKNLMDQILNELKFVMEKKTADEALQRLVLKEFGLFLHRFLQMALKLPEAKTVANLRLLLNSVLDGIQSKYASVAIAAYCIN